MRTWPNQMQPGRPNAPVSNIVCVCVCVCVCARARERSKTLQIAGFLCSLAVRLHAREWPTHVVCFSTPVGTAACFYTEKYCQ